MVAYISPTKDGNSKIEFVNEYGFTQDTYEVEAVHVELKHENIEPVNRKFLRAGGFIH